MKADNKAILKKANEAVSSGDNEGFLAFCTENITWTFVGDQTLVGKEAVRQYMKTAYVEPPKFTVEHEIAENEFLTIVGKISLKDETNELIHYSYCDVWRFEDGRMAGLKAFVIPVS